MIGLFGSIISIFW